MLPTILLRLDIETLRTIEGAARAGNRRFDISDAALNAIANARAELEYNAPHGPRSTLLAMTQTQAAAEYRDALAAAGAPAPWSVKGYDEIRDANGSTVCDFEELAPEQRAAAVASFTILAVNTAAGFRAIEREGELVWEAATR